ncbi:MAG: pyridoxamine 5'-phosphate oxidase family protein [Polaromonas sp.]|nr:pyridoxamine 5'-phosphate oxidase family protein [Polaromonas sp.]
MSNSSERETLWDLIKDIKFGMFTHRHADGRLHSHPLTTQNKSMDEGSVLYFFVPRSGEIAQRIVSDGKVNVAYADPDSDRYVSVSGNAALLEDQAKKEALFSSMTKAWFPGGATDPNLGLVAVQMDHAEYWDVKESKMVQLGKIATAAITGNRPELGEHGKLNLS